MLNKNKFRSRQHQVGVTIVELMISIVLGLLLLSAATAMTVKSMVMNGDTLASARLNQDLDSVLHVMVNDLRRAGFTGSTSVTAGVVFLPREDLNVVSANCVLYAYDASPPLTAGAGVLDATEKFGFKLVNGVIQMRTDCAAGACATDCSTGTWVNLTDTTMTNITGLTFDTQFSKCISITHPDNESATNNNNYWVTTTDAVTEFPCMAAAGTNLTNRYLDTNGVYQAGAFVPAASGDRLVEARQLNIELAGQKATDNSMIKSQKVAINVRNNHVYTVP